MNKQNVDMQRSISLTSNSKYFENKVLRRSHENEHINEEAETETVTEVQELLNVRQKHRRSQSARVLPLNSESYSTTSFLRISKKVSSSDSSTISSDKYEELAGCESNCGKISRLVEKNGKENVILRRIPDRSWHFLRDIVTTLIEWDWKYTLSMFICSYCFTWLLFALLCYMVAYSHGDFNFDRETGKQLHEGAEPCIVGVYDFLSTLIYSIETQTTVGFGEKYPSEECPETIMLFILQIICSIAIEGAMISMIYAKTSRPTRPLTKLKFSEKAVICYRDGLLCLIFRVCDPRTQQSINTKIRVYMIVQRPTAEGELLRSHVELKLVGNGEQIIEWPELICHVIDETSPLQHLTSAKGFNNAQFELYVSIVGTSPATAQITEARTSYVPREIFWGQSFVNIIHYDVENERYVVDHSNFNTTISVDMQATETVA